MGLLALLCSFDLAAPLSNRLYDRVSHIGHAAPDADVVVVAIDEAALDLLGGWPLPRSVYAEWLEKLAHPAHRPRGVALDLLFLNPTDHDERLARALSRHRAVLPLEHGYSSLGVLWERHPVAPLRQAAQLAQIGIELESDGFARGVPLVRNGRPHMSLALAQVSGQAAGKAAPEASYRRFAIATPGAHFQVVSLADVMSEGFALEFFRDKLVLLGVTASSLGDRFPVNHPGHELMPGVFLIAGAVHAALGRRFVDLPEPSTNLLANLALLSLAMACLVLLRPMACTLALLSLVMLSTAGAVLLRSQWNVWWSPVPFMLIAAGVYGVWGWRRMDALGSLIRAKSLELQQAAGLARSEAHPSGSQEVVLRHAALLEQTVEATALELNSLTTIIQRMPAAVGVYGAQGQWIAANPAWRQALGMAVDEDPHALPEVLARLGVRAEAWAPSSAAEPAFDAEPGALDDRQRVIELTTAGGRRFMYLDWSSVEMPVRGRLDILTLTDITYLKAYQDQRELALSFLSHDMRTPLASILALTRGTRGLDENTGQRIGQQAQALLDMMHDFLLLMSAGALRYELSEQLLADLTYSAIDQATELAQSVGIRIVEETATDTALVQVKAPLMVRALVNLLVNAIKFSPPGAVVQVKVEAHPERAGTVDTWICNRMAGLTTEIALPSHGIGTQFVQTVVARHGGSFERDFSGPELAWARISLPCRFLQEG